MMILQKIEIPRRKAARNALAEIQLNEHACKNTQVCYN